VRALLVVLALALPGCLGTPAATVPDFEGLVSPIRFEGLVAEALPYAADDGVVLDAWVFRPEGAEDVPVIINFSPYWSNLAPPTADGGDAFAQYLISYYVPRGYAVVLASARGTGLSEGCFTIGGPREVEDIDQQVTFYGTQPWSNGNVAAIAKSYDGTMAQAALTRTNPHLKTIVPVSPISEFYKYNYYGGVPYDFGGLLFNTYYVEAVSLRQSEDPRDPTWEKTPTRFCDESADVQASQYHGALTGDYSAYWQERNYTALLPDRIDASVFYIHGLQDWNVKPDHMTPWLDELYARGVTVKAWLGQWEHDYPHRDDWNMTLLRWFDSELKGIDTGIRAEPLVQVQDTEGVWRHEDRWPPTRATPLVLYPDANGALADAPGTGSAMYGDAPGGLPLAARAGMHVLYESAPLERDLRIVGSPVLTATVSATGPRATLSAALLVDGKVVDQGFLDLAHRNGLERGEPMVPGQSYEVSVPFYPQDLVVRAGSRLALYVASAAPEDAPVGVTPFSAGGAVTITHGASTMLRLPVIAADDVRIEARQPESLGCWTC